MIIALKTDPTKKYVVYGIYWATWREKFQRFHFVIECYDELSGFSILRGEDVDILDPDLDHYFMSKDDYGMETLIHKAAYPSKEFYYALIDHDDFANVEVLLKNMRKMGLEHYGG